MKQLGSCQIYFLKSYNIFSCSVNNDSAIADGLYGELYIGNCFQILSEFMEFTLFVLCCFNVYMCAGANPAADGQQIPGQPGKDQLCKASLSYYIYTFSIPPVSI